ncbi:Dual specificity protein phosphatase 23 [Bulinus truncatus]|nr:Dual specificity protein phosphatase 23 [Bulinus truncatus]
MENKNLTAVFRCPFKCGSLYGSMYGSMYGSIYGSMYGSIYGSLYGSIYGSMYGSLYGSMYGLIYGSMYGSMYGSLYGSMYGSIYGSLYGSIYGSMFVTMSVAPSNFSWVEEGVLAACAFPSSVDNVQFLVDNNIYSLVSLTAEKQVNREGITEEFQVVRVPIRDYTPPTMEQVETFLKTVEDSKHRGKATCVHCAHGLGRTGTMLSCYFVSVHGMSDVDAIAHVRALRPGSVETAEQEMLVSQFYSYWRQKMAQRKE